LEKVDLAIAPAKISKITPSVAISGTLHNLFITGVGCDVGIAGVLGLRPGG
jgi:hypothetical protein